MIVRSLFLAMVFLTQAAFAEKIPAFQDKKEWFQAFLRNTDQKVEQKKGALAILQNLYPNLWERIQDPNYPFVSVFVGAGSGGMEIPLMEEFAKIREDADSFTVFCEDPSSEMRDEFFSNASDAMKKQVAEYILLPFEDPAYLPPQADFALASHVWYFVKNWIGVDKEKNALVKFASLIQEKKGGGLITLQSNTGGRYLINSACASLIGKNKELVAEKIAEELDRLGIDYRIVPLESHLNVSSCFEKGRFNPNFEGKCLLSFLLFEWWDDLPSDVQERMKDEFLARIEANGKEELVMRDLQICISPSA